MAEWGFDIDYWHWLIAALVLLVLEIAAPGVFFLWMAAAALVVGIVTAIAPDMGLAAQFILFAVLSLVSVLVGRRLVRTHPVPTEDTTLNRRGEQHVGHVYRVAHTIENGVGKVKVGDSLWTAEGPDTPEGTAVRVVAVDGAVLKVEKVD